MLPASRSIIPSGNFKQNWKEQASNFLRIWNRFFSPGFKLRKTREGTNRILLYPLANRGASLWWDLILWTILFAQICNSEIFKFLFFRDSVTRIGDYGSEGPWRLNGCCLGGLWGNFEEEYGEAFLCRFLGESLKFEQYPLVGYVHQNLEKGQGLDFNLFMIERFVLMWHTVFEINSKITLNFWSKIYKFCEFI